MIHAYDKVYLEKARTALGRMLDFAVYDLHLDLTEFWKQFLDSDVCKRFEQGDSSLLAGMSGIEMAYAVIGDASERIQPKPSMDRSEEYWLGWALAYYQWNTGIPFREIFDAEDIMKIKALYYPYHEMDIRHFCDLLDERYLSNRTTKLKQYRQRMGLSQSQLAEESGVPLRTIQQYEQRQKNINMARAECVIKLAKTLYCEPEELMEKVSMNQ